MKHQMIIHVTDPRGHKHEVLKSGEIRLKDRLLSSLFGNHRILVLAPADSVETVSIQEVSADGPS